VTNTAFLSRGFRPFFLGGSIFAIAGMAAWMAIFIFAFPVELRNVTPFQWHAHEMIYGYAMAVIAGFLLTAAWNWTGRRTADGLPLAALFALWAAARIMMFGGTTLIAWATVADLAFMAGLVLAIARPIIKTRQARHAPVLLLLLLLAITRLVFTLGVVGVIDDGARTGVYGGLYLVLGMVLFMGRRVIPFFTQRGVEYDAEPRNDRWNDIATLVAYPLFAISEILFPFHVAGALLAGILLLLNTLRVLGWHTMGIWRRPLLWGLFVAVVMINLGFMMRALMPVTAVPPLLPIHAYTVGGIGIITLSMMARVTLGHTGRNVHRAPPVMNMLLGGMLLAATARIFLPLIDPTHYLFWIWAAAGAWMASFLLFLVVFGPMLVSKRINE
jgi:uncharacterized protein involved in response to NO